MLPSQDPVGSIAPSPSCSVSSSAAFLLRPRGRASYAGAITIPFGVLLGREPSGSAHAWVEAGRQPQRRGGPVPVSLLFSVFCWFLLIFGGIFAGFCGFCQISPDLAWFLLAPAGLFWFLPVFCGFSLGLSRVLLEFPWGCAGLCWFLLASAGLCWFLLAFAGLCWFLPGFPEFLVSLFLSGFLSLQLNVKTSSQYRRVSESSRAASPSRPAQPQCRLAPQLLSQI